MPKAIRCVIIFWALCCMKCTSGKLREAMFNGPCRVDEYRCLNDKCVSKEYFCNGRDDCGDNSDERYCSVYNCPSHYPFYKCQSRYDSSDHRCIPERWRCDGVRDCSGDRYEYNHDEMNCAEYFRKKEKMSIGFQIHSSKSKALNFFYDQGQNTTSTGRWGPHVQKIAVALNLSDVNFNPLNGKGREMAYELSIQLLSMIAKNKMNGVKTKHLAPYINALLVTCVDPRNFHSIDLVKELRVRVNAQNYTNPYDLLTLCNAGEKITRRDIDKLLNAFKFPRHHVWTETQAIVVMALVCAGRQQGSSFPLTSLKNFTSVLMQKQFRNGTVEDLKTTALVMQALFAALPEEDEDNFDEEKAMLQILQTQKADGSFGTLVDTYYVLPVLDFKSLVNISANHCPPHLKDGDAALEDLSNQTGPKVRVRYSLWIGDEKDVERTIKLRVAQPSSFYSVMEKARDIDSKYSFQYIVKDTKPYITSISGLSDDPETGKFWFPYLFNGTKPTLLETSPVELFPEENDHIAFWYRSGQWIK